MYRRTGVRVRAWVGLVAGLALTGHAGAFEFNFDNSCVLLNADNTDILTRPDACLDLPIEEAHWCNCTRTALRNRTRGEATVFEQGVIWVTDGDPGIGNHRVEVGGGTLDVSGLSAGQVIGETLTNELVPQSVGVPPGTFFMMRSEIVVTGVDANVVSLDVRVVEVSQIVPLILTYSPFDAAHSNGLLYRAQLVAGGPDGGFVFEYRYEAEEGATWPAIEPSDAGSPGFNVRFGISLFTRDAVGIYTLPNAATLEVVSTLRKFTDASDMVVNPDEIRPFGEDLCEVLEGGEGQPCREFIDEIDLESAGGGNVPPEAVIVATNIQLQPLIDNEVFVDCGEARAILRGSNSTDGDDGSQGLTFLWEVVDEPSPGAAAIPPETVEFMDTEVTMLEVGDYTFRLTVDDGQDMFNTDSEEITIIALDGVETNEPPQVFSLTYRPDGTNEVEVWDAIAGEQSMDIEVELVDGSATVIDLDVDADTGADGCFQANTFLWEAIDPPAPVAFSAAADEDTDVTFSAEGEYVLRLTLDDGAPENNISVIEVTIFVVGGGGVGPFLRGDCAQEGSLSLTSGIFLLNFLFLGGDTPACRAACDANGDGNLDISTAVYLFNFLFLGGPPPPAAACGVSNRPEDIGLGCETPQACP